MRRRCGFYPAAQACAVGTPVLAGERIAARKDASTWLAQSESGERDQRRPATAAVSDRSSTEQSGLLGSSACWSKSVRRWCRSHP